MATNNTNKINNTIDNTNKINAVNVINKNKMREEYRILCEEIPNPKCALNFTNPFELLIATVLSAQTTDKRVNLVTSKLFKEYPTPVDLAKAQIYNVQEIIHSLGFYRVKSQHIIELSQKLVKDFNGVVPNNMADLTKLPGVGRKTANVVLGNAFKIPGFPVDTHVMRVTSRLGWVSEASAKAKDAAKIEREVTACFAPEEWTNLSHRLILHGRMICIARNPRCADCPLRFLCPSVRL